MNGRILLLWFGLVLATAAQRIRAEWIQGEAGSEISTVAGVVHQHFTLADDAAGGNTTLDLVRFSPKSARLRLIDNPNRQDLSAALSPTTALAAVNGGYFDESFRPLGLRINAGTTVSPLVRGRLMTGVLACSGSRIQVLRVGEFRQSHGLATALQCGPFLIDRGAAVPGLNRDRVARRTFAATTTTGDAILGYCSSASLGELPAVLKAAAGPNNIQRALNLDGGSSSAFWFRRKDGTTFSIPEQKDVRDFVAVVPAGLP